MFSYDGLKGMIYSKPDSADEVAEIVAEKLGVTASMGSRGKLGVFWPNDPNPSQSDSRMRKGVDRRVAKKLKNKRTLLRRAC